MLSAHQAPLSAEFMLHPHSNGLGPTRKRLPLRIAENIQIALHASTRLQPRRQLAILVAQEACVCRCHEPDPQPGPLQRGAVLMRSERSQPGIRSAGGSGAAAHRRQRTRRILAEREYQFA
jgi:hypothetical protein